MGSAWTNPNFAMARDRVVGLKSEREIAYRRRSERLGRGMTVRRRALTFSSGAVPRNAHRPAYQRMILLPGIRRDRVGNSRRGFLRRRRQQRPALVVDIEHDSDCVCLGHAYLVTKH